jgi:type VI protein secretion system component VasK
VRIERFKSFIPSLLPGFSWRAKILPTARELYLRKFRPFFETYVTRPLEDRLQDFRGGGPTSSEAAYDDLRTYLLLGSEKERLDAGQQAAVVESVRKILEQGFVRTLTEDQAAEIKSLVGPQIEHFVRILALRETPAFENDSLLIRSVRRLIIENRETGVAVIYARLKSKGLELLTHPIVLSQILPGSGVLSSDISVPEFFTQNGWKGYVRNAIEKESELPAAGDWVLGQTEPAAAPDVRDPKAIAEALEQAYFLDYYETWWQFCRSVQYHAPESLEAIAALLKKLADGENSPIFILLKRVDEETRIAPGEGGGAFASGLVAKIGRATGLSERKDSEAAAATPAAIRNFDKLHALFSPQGKEGKDAGGGAALQGILGSYAIAGEVLDGLAKDSGTKTMDAAVQILSQEKGELPDALKAVRKSFPDNGFDLESRQAIFERPIQIAWAAILGEVEKSLNAQWQKRVHEVYRTTLAEYYPFSLQGKDSALQDVKRFFDPQSGALQAFLAEKLKDFLDLEALSVRTWEGKGLTFSDAFLGAVRHGKEIGEALFSQGGLKVAFSLQPEQYEKVSAAAPVIDQVNIVIDGRADQYRMGGVRATEFVWPGDPGPPGASLAVNARQVSFPPRKFAGEWGWFRLLDEAVFEFVNPKEFVISWLYGTKNVDEVKVSYRMTFRSAHHPFQAVDRRFFDFACPDRLD